MIAGVELIEESGKLPKLWLTYAWKDNEEADVDYVIGCLREKGLDVRFDRVHLLAGRRLWDQIDAGIADLSVDAWAILVTENSLQSEPCQEEIAYALDRSLRTRGSFFPLIGIFPQQLDRSIIPSALATRLYVSLQDVSWIQQVFDGVSGTNTQQVETPLPYICKTHFAFGSTVIEVRPRAGRWNPFSVLVPCHEAQNVSRILVGPKDIVPYGGMVTTVVISNEDLGLQGKMLYNTVDAMNSAYIFLNSNVSKLVFGQLDISIHEVSPL